MGILMERYDLDGDRASEVLKRHSQQNDRQLRVVAQELVDSRKIAGRKVGGCLIGPSTEPAWQAAAPWDHCGRFRSLDRRGRPTSAFGFQGAD